jgi:hypothetical protein
LRESKFYASNKQVVVLALLSRCASSARCNNVQHIRGAALSEAGAGGTGGGVAGEGDMMKS